MRVCISRAGTVFLWPVPLPTADGRLNSWHQSQRNAAELGENQWTRMRANMGAGSYDITVAPPGVSEPRWPTETFAELLKIAFGNGRLIDRLDHPVLKRLRGE
jgi:hypothetical protein